MNALAFAEHIDITVRDLLLLTEIRTANQSGSVYPNQPQDSWQHESIDALAHAGLVLPIVSPAPGGWIATAQYDADE